jgi:hypothetical protein
VKKPIIVLTALTFLLIFDRKIFAQEIHIGNVSAKSEVNTQIEGNGNVQTHIEVQINEEKKTLDATGSGEYKLEINSSNNSNSKISVTATPSIKKTNEIVKQTKKNNFEFFNILKNLLGNLKALFKI